MADYLNTAEYTLLSKSKGAIDNNVGIEIGLRSGTTLPSVNEDPQLIIANNERMIFKTETGEQMYGIIIEGELERDYKVEIAGFSFGHQSAVTRIDDLEDAVTIGEDGTKYKVVACVIENTGSGWEIIDDATNSPVNVSSISNDTAEIQIDFSFTGLSVGSFVVTPNRVFTKEGYLVGANAGTDSALIEISQSQKTIGGYVYYNGASWVVEGDNIGNLAVTSFNAGTLTLSHDSVGTLSYLASADARDTAYCSKIGTLGDISSEVKFYDATGTIVAVEDTSMKMYFNRTSPEKVSNPATVINANGSFYIYGIFEVL